MVITMYKKLIKQQLRIIWKTQPEEIALNNIFELCQICFKANRRDIFRNLVILEYKHSNAATGDTDPANAQNNKKDREFLIKKLNKVSSLVDAIPKLEDDLRNGVATGLTLDEITPETAEIIPQGFIYYTLAQVFINDSIRNQVGINTIFQKMEDEIIARGVSMETTPFIGLVMFRAYYLNLQVSSKFISFLGNNIHLLKNNQHTYQMIFLKATSIVLMLNGYLDNHEETIDFVRFRLNQYDPNIEELANQDMTTSEHVSLKFYCAWHELNHTNKFGKETHNIAYHNWINESLKDLAKISTQEPDTQKNRIHSKLNGFLSSAREYVQELLPKKQTAGEIVDNMNKILPSGIKARYTENRNKKIKLKPSPESILIHYALRLIEVKLLIIIKMMFLRKDFVALTYSYYKQFQDITSKSKPSYSLLGKTSFFAVISGLFNKGHILENPWTVFSELQTNSDFSREEQVKLINDFLVILSEQQIKDFRAEIEKSVNYSEKLIKRESTKQSTTAFLLSIIQNQYIDSTLKDNALRVLDSTYNNPPLVQFFRWQIRDTEPVASLEGLGNPMLLSAEQKRLYHLFFNTEETTQLKQSLISFRNQLLEEGFIPTQNIEPKPTIIDAPTIKTHAQKKSTVVVLAPIEKITYAREEDMLMIAGLPLKHYIETNRIEEMCRVNNIAYEDLKAFARDYGEYCHSMQFGAEYKLKFNINFWLNGYQSLREDSKQAYIEKAINERVGKVLMPTNKILMPFWIRQEDDGTQALLSQEKVSLADNTSLYSNLTIFGIRIADLCGRFPLTRDLLSNIHTINIVDYEAFSSLLANYLNEKEIELEDTTKLEISRGLNGFYEMTEEQQSDYFSILIHTELQPSEFTVYTFLLEPMQKDPYRIVMTNQASKDIKTSTPKRRDLFNDVKKLLQQDPFKGSPKTYEKTNRWSMRLSWSDRVLYEIDKEEKTVRVLRARTHYGD